MNVANIIVGLLVVGLLIARQLRKRRIDEEKKPRLVLILAALGVVQTVQFVQQHQVAPSALGLLVVSLALGAGLGLVRARTVRLWREDGELWRQGSVITAVLWIVSIAVHLAADALIDATGGAHGLGSVSILLYLGITLGVQQLVTKSRAATVAHLGLH